MFAKVIVDVSAKETDRTFDYAVPEHLQGWIEIGSRVGVPFGSRVIQGFVVDIQESSQYTTHKIKEISQVLDTVPPLDKEMIELSEWMSRHYVCSRITAIQSLIPGALKAVYEKELVIHEASEQFLAESEYAFNVQAVEIIDFIRNEKKVTIEALHESFPQDGRLIKQLIRIGVIREQQRIKDRLQTKKLLYVIPPDTPTVLEEALSVVSGRATKQKIVLQYLLAHMKPIAVTELTKQTGADSSTIRTLADKGWITVSEREVFRDPYALTEFAPSKALPLTMEQQAVFQQIVPYLHRGEHRSFLLHGVTGSGKTEIYLQAIEQCIQLGREAIVLVPEISLTPQMVERFKGRFGDLVAVLHSRLSQGERYDEWRKIQMNKVKVAIGARSAVFAPFSNLGLIIIDEEHEGSYKQEESPKYHARDVAKVRGKTHNALVILGSATPSLESYYEATQSNGGQLELLTIPSRVENRPLPTVQIVDMREEMKQGHRSMFSRPLSFAIQDKLTKGEQIVLMLNRRGYSTFVMCRTCGFTVECPHCDIALTYHQHTRLMRCHYCGYAEREVHACPSCESEHIRFFGTGTQRVEEQLMMLFPGIRIIRMDVDTTSEKGSHEKLLRAFRDRKADVLLGTQMVAKGLDFPFVTLVGVIAADTVLHLPDFRAAEKTFQLLTQVAGRAGRHQLPGEVVIQTYNPDHYSILCAEQHHYGSFAERELQIRLERKYPPFCRLVLMTLSHENQVLLLRAAEQAAMSIRKEWQQYEEAKAMVGQRQHSRVEILGPVAPAISRIKDRYRFHCMIKYEGNQEIFEAVLEMVRKAMMELTDRNHKSNLQVTIDVDPQMMM